MNNAPERIWAASVTENYGEWQTTTDGLPRPTKYIRADLVAELAAEVNARIEALEAENARLAAENKRAVEGWSKSQDKQIEALDRAEKAEAEVERMKEVLDQLGTHLYKLEGGDGFGSRLIRAKAAAQADYERRILSTLTTEPAAQEGWQEAGRIGDAVLDWMVKFDLLDGGNEYYVADVLAVLNDLQPSPRPSEQAVTEAMIEAAVRAVKDHLYNNGDGKTSFIRECDIRAAIRAALKAAMEAEHD